MTTPIESAFPSRAIRIVAPSFSLGFFFLLLALLPLPFAVGLLRLPIDEIRRDYAISQNPVLVSGAEICTVDCVGGSGEPPLCRTQVRFQHDGRPEEQVLATRSLGQPGACRQGNITIAGDNPAHISLTHDYSSIMRSTAQRLILGAGLALFSLVMLAKAIPVLLARRVAGRRYLLKPVIVDLSGSQVLRYTTSLPLARGAIKTAYTRMKPGENPLYLRPTADNGTPPTAAFAAHDYPALAVVAEGVSLPILLDDKLTRLELSAPERKRIRAAIDETIGSTAGDIVTPASVRERLIRPLLRHRPLDGPRLSPKWAHRLAISGAAVVAILIVLVTSWLDVFSD
ncbi:hypothetical protein [Ensifer sp.]|uniref:hypothetical protein n=1 Tax=Ensifer sp. TaxID=1872086 RepID=UPI0028979B65|nr:hypothetical protein [Ensifer sp.]